MSDQVSHHRRRGSAVAAGGRACRPQARTRGGRARPRRVCLPRPRAAQVRVHRRGRVVGLASPAVHAAGAGRAGAGRAGHGDADVERGHRVQGDAAARHREPRPGQRAGPPAAAAPRGDPAARAQQLPPRERWRRPGPGRHAAGAPPAARLHQRRDAGARLRRISAPAPGQRRASLPRGREQVPGAAEAGAFDWDDGRSGGDLVCFCAELVKAFSDAGALVVVSQAYHPPDHETFASTYRAPPHSPAHAHCISCVFPRGTRRERVGASSSGALWRPGAAAQSSRRRRRPR